jgi:hypothetical protein
MHVVEHIAALFIATDGEVVGAIATPVTRRNPAPLIPLRLSGKPDR